jgi:hypothetical protein
LLNPDADWVGLAVLPPATSVSNKCTTPQTTNYDSRSAAYTIVPLSHDYSTNGRLNTTSNLVSTMTCHHANGETSYATAIEQAQAELDLHGRPNVTKVVVPADRVERERLLQPAQPGTAEHDLHAGGAGHPAGRVGPDRRQHALATRG